MANILGFAQNLRMDDKIGGMLDDYQRQRNIEREMLNREAASKLQAETMGLQNEQARMSLAALRRQQDVDRMAREAYAGARPTTLSNPAYVSPEQFSLAATAGPPTEYITPEFEQGMTAAKGLEYPGQGVAPRDIASLQNLRPETLTKPADPYGAMADVYAREGDMAGVKNVYSMQDIIAAAKAKGDPEEYYKAQFTATTYDNFIKRVSPLLNTEAGRAQAQKISEAYQAMHPDDADMYDISDWQITEAGIANPVKDRDTGKVLGHMITDGKGNTSFYELDKATETWGKPYETEIGGKKIRVQDSSTGQQRMIAGDTSTTVKVNTGTSKAEKDLPPGIQDKLSTKLEVYNDWSTLKDKFRPEFMPRTPIKSIGELQINLSKIFGGNQDAIDWWTQYFDSRNIILKERSGAAVMEPEFKRFEQGTIAANTNPQTVINYLDRSAKKYKQHVDAYVSANEKNHPEGVKAFKTAYGYESDKPAGKPAGKKPLSAY